MDQRHYFANGSRQLKLVWGAQESTLRVAQLGALWALASHFSLSRDPVQAVLPTGVGKTAVMTALPFVIPTRRVLVVAPSQLVRDQVAEQFRTLGVLRATGALPSDTPGPVVGRLLHEVTSPEAWLNLEQYDVVVATPRVTSSAYDRVAAIPRGLFDLLIVDEAHHVVAQTWKAVLDQMRGVCIALFTATPFRRDRAHIPAGIAYAYPLAQAIHDGVYQPVDFVPVDIVRGEDRDLALARAAAARLSDPAHAAARSALLVRTDSIRESERLVDVYQQVGVDIGVIHSRQALRTAQATLRRLRDGELRGIASVGVLGEGFDLPRLKIAVYHRPHRSLPATLQFIGRVSRVRTDGARPPAELIAVREDIQDETRQLYASDAAWGQLVPALSEAAVERERARRQYVLQFEREGSGDFSWFAVRPRLQAELFEVPDGAEVVLRTDVRVLVGAPVLRATTDDAGRLLAIVTRSRYRPTWLEDDALDVDTHELHLVYHDAERRLLFISTPSRAASDTLLDLVGVPDAPRAAPSAMNRILHSVNIAGYSSIGLRSARAAGSRNASYRTLAGSTVNQALLPGEARAYGVGHLIGRHTGPAGQPASMGVSVARAKIWSTDRADLLGYREWCANIGRMARSASAVGNAAPLLAITLPQRLERYPDTPIVAVLDPTLLQGDVLAILPSGATPSLALFSIEVTRQNDACCCLTFVLDGKPTWECLVRADGRIEPRSEPLTVWLGNQAVDLCELLKEECPTIYFADGSSVVGCVHYVPPEAMPFAPAEMLMRWDWTGVDIQAEAKPGRDGRPNVQEATRDWALRTLGRCIVIDDDAAGELADLVVIQMAGGRVTVHLVHCKWSSRVATGQRLDDVHVVLCQAMRSARWTGVRTFWQELDRRLDERAATRIVHPEEPLGAREQIRRWASEPPATSFRVMAVQPGLRLENVTAHEAINCLLVCCYEWVRDQGAELVVVGS